MTFRVILKVEYCFPSVRVDERLDVVDAQPMIETFVQLKVRLFIEVAQDDVHLLGNERLYRYLATFDATFLGGNSLNIKVYLRVVILAVRRKVV